MLRFEHIGVVVEDLDAMVEFFAGLGFEHEGGTTVEGDTVSKINGLEGVRADIAMMRTPDRTGRLELVRYLTPVDSQGPQPSPANRLGFRHIALEVDDVNGIVDGLRAKGLETVGEVCDYERAYRLVYVRGPEGLIIELAEALADDAASRVAMD